MHAPVDVLLLSIVAESLLDHLAALTIKHALVSHLLVTGRLIVINLVTLGYALSVSVSGSLSLCLINFTHWFAVGANLRRVAVRLDLEVTTFAHAASEVARVHQHSLRHVFHHFVNASEAHHISSFSVEKWVICKWVLHHHHASAKALEHLVSHLVHLFRALLSTREHVI